MRMLINAEKRFLRPGDTIFWTRTELTKLLTVYGRHVAAGEWRDYGMSTNANRAVFTVHRQAHEAPLYRIEKISAHHHSQSIYQLISTDGRIIRRRHNLPALLCFFNKRAFKVIR